LNRHWQGGPTDWDWPPLTGRPDRLGLAAIDRAARPAGIDRHWAGRPDRLGLHRHWHCARRPASLLRTAILERAAQRALRGILGRSAGQL